ncbi:50S ribosomal protein L29 [Buchnera aphidicola (Cinara kochiana kochiana)]|uniref:Large ribosomal subunit protein uL29 n=1 Tax=Buchnera aphidicola (Cinara kochiana kochiana) TaxID=2518976 RepID=A0A451D5W0_9GAMM|nr:50S ribosomal protein L29 [Buchnera aphidicola]VFP81240.1 50S ribosomal protein L29 [Buchnera aphidicola (Cinara kochiana kochiana)]
MHNITQYNINKQDLKKKLLELLQEQFNVRLQLSSGKLKKTHLIRKIRRKIARIKTLLMNWTNN